MRIHTLVIAIVASYVPAQSLYPGALLQPTCAYSFGGSYAVGRGVLADMDGDGDADYVGTDGYAVAVCKIAGGIISSGTCYPPPPATNSPIGAIAVADMDGDGDLDIVAATVSQSPYRVLVWLNDGTGSLPNPPLVKNTSIIAHRITIARVNTDSIPDVILTSALNPSVLLLGTGGGNLGAPFAGPTVSTDYLILRDDDQDGDDDLHEAYQGNFITWRNNGAGIFTPITRFSGVPGAYPSYQFAAFGDFNVDGNLDAAIVGTLPSNGPGYIQVAPGNGAGAFVAGPAQQITNAGTGVRSIALSDLDFDGDLDFLVSVTDGTFQVMNVAGSFPASTLLTTVDGTILLGDVTGDGLVDVAVDSTYWSGFALLAQSPSGPPHATSFSVPANGLTSEVADIDADGRPDAIVGWRLPPPYQPVTSAGVTVFLDVDSAPAFSQTITTGTDEVTDVATADWNRDGLLDVLLATTANDIRLCLGNPGGTLSAPVVTPVGVPISSMIAADVDGDGAPDVILNHDTSVSVRLGNGVGGFHAPIFTTICPNPLTSSCYSASITVEDIDRDGRVDLVVAVASTLSVYLGNGTGAFTLLSTIATGGGVQPTVQRDLNGDGIPDILLMNWTASFPSYVVSAWLERRLGLPGGGFGPAATYAVTGYTTLNWGSFAAGDLNGDGFPDAVAFGVVFLNDGAGGFVQHEVLPDSQSNEQVAICDLNRDLQPDLVFRLDTRLVLYHGVTPCSATGYAYGIGCAGGGGFVPELSASGCASPGGALTLAVDHAIGGSPQAVLVVGPGPTSAPVGYGCTILVDLAGSFMMPIGVSGPSVAGQGRGALSVIVPPSLPPGTTVAVQAAIADPGSPLGLSGSNGLVLVVH